MATMRSSSLAPHHHLIDRSSPYSFTGKCCACSEHDDGEGTRAISSAVTMLTHLAPLLADHFGRRGLDETPSPARPRLPLATEHEAEENFPSPSARAAARSTVDEKCRRDRLGDRASEYHVLDGGGDEEANPCLVREGSTLTLFLVH